MNGGGPSLNPMKFGEGPASREVMIFSASRSSTDLSVLVTTSRDHNGDVKRPRRGRVGVATVRVARGTTPDVRCSA